MAGLIALEPGRATADAAERALPGAGLLSSLRPATVVLTSRASGAALQAVEAEVATLLADTVVVDAGLHAAIDELNQVLPRHLGVTVQALSFANATLRTRAGGDMPDAAAADAVRSWRFQIGNGAKLRLRQGPGGTLVPVAAGVKVLGALRISSRRPLSDEVADLLVAIGRRLAWVAQSVVLRERIIARERGSAVAAERARIAQDLHDSVCQVVAGMGMQLTQLAEDASDASSRDRLSDLAALSDRANRELRAAIEGLLFSGAAGDGLTKAIQRLCRDFTETTGTAVEFEVRGTTVPLGCVKEDALFRVAREALANIARHAHAPAASVHLIYEDESVTLWVRDCGVGLTQDGPERPGHFGIRAMRRRIEDAGGDLHVRSAAPCGVLVEAVLPGRKRTADAAGTGGGRR